MNKGNGFFHDTDGGQSMMRLLTFFVVVLILTVWAGICIGTHSLVDIPNGVLGVLIAAVTGKLLQKGVEVWGAAQAGASTTSDSPPLQK